VADELGLDLDRLLRQRGWLRSLARGLVGDGEVDDLLQESWLAALRARSAPRTSLHAWFAGLARNAARSVRREAPRGAGDCETLACAAEDAGELLARAELQERLIAAVRALRDPYRATVLLHYFEGLPLEEVGRRTGVPGSTARTRLSRALAELRERLGRERGGGAWALLAELARGGTGGITASTLELTAMGTLVKLSIGGVAAAGLALAVWWQVDAGGARSAERVAASPGPAEALARTRDESPTAEPVSPRAPVPSESGLALTPDSPREVPVPAPVASTPLERLFDSVAETLLTEEPDVVGLLSLSRALADSASVVPDSLVVGETSVSGKLEAGENLKGSFSIVGPKYQVELGTWNIRKPFRTFRLEFTEEAGVVNSARVTLSSSPTKEEDPSLGGQELTGWRVTIDAGQGAKVHRTTTRIDDPALLFENAAPDHRYLYETSDVPDLEPREMPWLATDAFDPWLGRLRPLRDR